MFGQILQRIIRKITRIKSVISAAKTDRQNQDIKIQDIKIQNRNIKIPLILKLRCDWSEVWMIGLLENLLQVQEGVFLDVGVNLGQTLIKVKAIAPQRKYIGFEPNPACVFYIKELIKANQFVDCTIFPVGLFTEDTVLTLDCINDTEVDSAASLIKNFRPDHAVYHQLMVPVLRFQSITNALNIQTVGIVKIDVEGAELEVVKTLYPLLTEQRPLVLLEILPVYSVENMMRKERQEELEQLFEQLNYSFYRVSKTINDEFIGLGKIEKIGIHSNLNQCDYIVIPDELIAKFQGVVEDAAL
jgi:FkbM family methyltransferase